MGLRGRAAGEGGPFFIGFGGFGIYGRRLQSVGGEK